MPQDHILDVGDVNAYTYITTDDNDFAYIFPRGANLWACLIAFPNDRDDLDETPAVFLSIDGGASWSLQDRGGAPIANKVGELSVNYDSRFNYIDPALQSKITLISANDGSLPTYEFHLVDFDLDTQTYGAPYGAISLLRWVGGRFSSRPDGSFIYAYTREDASEVPVGTFYRIYSGGWGGEQTLTGRTFAGIQNLAVDSTGQAHLTTSDGTYYRVSAAGSLVQTASIPAGGTGNLTILGDSLLIGYTDFSSISLITGTPLSNPSWTTEAVSGSPTSRRYVWVQNFAGSYALALEQFGPGDAERYDYTIYSSGFSATGLAVQWFSQDQQSVQRAIKTAGVWGATSTIWMAAVPATGLLSLAARAGGAGPANRYRPIW